jgi:hypothetical protein
MVCGVGKHCDPDEHDMRVVAGSDWVIEIGPGAGDEGGRVVAAGTPAEVAQSSTSRTAPYLARFLEVSTKKCRLTKLGQAHYVTGLSVYRLLFRTCRGSETSIAAGTSFCQKVWFGVSQNKNP